MPAEQKPVRVRGLAARAVRVAGAGAALPGAAP
jgi:hypothetical protein